MSYWVHLMIDVEDACAADAQSVVEGQFEEAEVHRLHTSELLQFAVLNFYVEDHLCVRESAKTLAKALGDRGNPEAVVHVSLWGADAPDDIAAAYAEDYLSPSDTPSAQSQNLAPTVVAQSDMADDIAAIRAVEAQLGPWQGPRPENAQGPGPEDWREALRDPDSLVVFTRIMTVAAAYAARACDVVDGHLRAEARTARVGEYEFIDWADGPDCGGEDSLDFDVFESDDPVRDLTTGEVVFGPTRRRAD